MTKAVQHTPTPWEISGATHVFAGGERGANICVVSEPRATTHVDYTRLSLSSPDREEAYANAEFIVRACNSHDDLLDACGSAKAAIEVVSSVDPTVRKMLEPTWRKLIDVIARAESKA